MRLDGLRIALVGPLPPPVGGMAVLTEQLAGLLRSDGARVELVQINAPYRPAWAARLKGVRPCFACCLISMACGAHAVVPTSSM